MNSKLRKKLLDMSKKDQKMRNSGKYSSSIDKENTLELKKILKKYGWPTYAMVGKKASESAWLIVQHSDHDVRFKKNV